MPPPYADLEIHIREPSRHGYRVDLRLNGLPCLGQGMLDPSFLPWIPSSDARADGEGLFGSLFADSALRAAWTDARSLYPRRHIRLHVDAEAPELHQIPWELLREPGTPTSPALDLAAGELTPFSRFLAVKGIPPQPLARQRLRTLIVIANPSNLDHYGLAPIAVDREWTSLSTVFEGLDLICDQLPAPCTLSSLGEKLREGYHILHIVAHGAYAAPSASAVLMLADKQNQVCRVTDRDIAGLLERLGAGNEAAVPHLIFLASCQSAMRSPADAFRGLAPQIVRAGVPFVVAMQDWMRVDAAREYAATFYSQLLSHGIVDLAANQARGQVITDRLPGASCPVLFMRSINGELFAKAREGQETADNQVLWTVDYRPNKHFVGRNDELVRLHEALAAGPVGLTGLGGIGKTQLAVEYCHRYQASYPGGVFWIDAAKPLMTGFAIQGAERNRKSPDDVKNDAHDFAAYLRRHGDALLVLDNLSDPADLTLPVVAGVIPAELPCKVLFTTRVSSNLEFDLIEVTVLGEQAALELLLRADSRQSIRESSHPEHGEARTICRTLGNLPLALDLAAAFLGKKPEVKLVDYRCDLEQRSPLLVLDDPHAKLRDKDLPTRHRAAVAATFAEQVDMLPSRESVLVLQVAGQLSELASLPEAWLGLLSGLSEQGGGVFGSPLGLAVDELAEVSLVKRLETGAVNLHPLVHEFAASLTPSESRQAFRASLVDHAIESLTDPDRPADWPITVGRCLLAFGWTDVPQEKRIAVLEAVCQVMVSSVDEGMVHRAAFLLMRLDWLGLSRPGNTDDLLVYLDLVARYAQTHPDRQYLADHITCALDAGRLDPLPEAQLRVYRGAMLGGMDQLEDAARDYARAMSLIEDTSVDTKLAVRIYLGSGGIAQRRLEGLSMHDPQRRDFLHQAKKWYECAAELARTHPLGPVLELIIHKELGYVEGLLGNWQRADGQLRLASEALPRIADETTRLTYWATIVNTAASIEWLKGEEQVALGDLDQAYIKYSEASQLAQGVIGKLHDLPEELDELPYALYICGEHLLSMSRCLGDRSPSELQMDACENWRRAFDVARRLGIREIEQKARQRLDQHCSR